MTSHCITWRDTTQAITSHQMTWPSHDLTPQQTSRHQNTSLQSTKHHHHGTAEGSFTAKKWFGHRAGRSPCAHSIGKFFLWLIVFFLWNFRPRLVRVLLVSCNWQYIYISGVYCELGDYKAPIPPVNGTRNSYWCRLVNWCKQNTFQSTHPNGESILDENIYIHNHTYK